PSIWRNTDSRPLARMGSSLYRRTRVLIILHLYKNGSVRSGFHARSEFSGLIRTFWEFRFSLRLSIYLLRLSITFSTKISKIIIDIPYHLWHCDLIIRRTD